jgi:hypothetical protein
MTSTNEIRELEAAWERVVAENLTEPLNCANCEQAGASAHGAAMDGLIAFPQSQPLCPWHEDLLAAQRFITALTEGVQRVRDAAQELADTDAPMVKVSDWRGRESREITIDFDLLDNLRNALLFDDVLTALAALSETDQTKEN